ncbi:MAG: hypothetical protein D8M58_08095 [Calditrichaeota bacterium]|nr:MAG: hypothetical protein DWQ03_18395 [Calditrichota bacterium]MBL1205343.1 hypothetical protein [Calditrichota bacterium]NOG45172.1 carbohydrate binding family 9 domain-containing protein [Calditrichota bacterium]
MKLDTIFFILLVFFFSTILFADPNDGPPEKITAIRVTEEITIDGLLIESVWNENKGISYFKQRDPKEGADPSQKTVVYIAYNDENLYVAARLFDSEPDSIMARLGRKDQSMDTDLFGFYVDPYYDKRSGFYFGLSAAGTYYDGVLYNDDWDDDSWDGVWVGKTTIDENGWNVEMRIPFSQLRFKEETNIVWGINFIREISRNQEEVFLSYKPKDESGFVSRFVDLVGLEGLKPSNNFQILPYVRVKSEHIQTEKGNPFNDGSRQQYGVGADFKYGITSNITLDGTINPDFGQVEVDPAVINLSDFETFFSERRPFFIEGASIFRFGRGGSNSNWGFNWGDPNFFYSRRIGKAPTGPNPESAEFIDRPDGSRILGAGKISGKLGNGWNLGFVTAVTDREYADFEHIGRTDSLTNEFTRGKQDEFEVEPLSSYNVLRVQKEFDEGRHALGLISTATIRNFKNNSLRDYVNSEAYSFGLDGWTFLDDDKMWVVNGWTGFSSVHGNKTKITNLQRSSRHRYHRPDFDYASLDSNATSLNGFAGRVAINKQKGNWRFNSALGIIDPGFDVNDLGFMWRTNVINAHMAGGYRWTKPTEYFRYLSVLGSLFGSKDFDGNTTWAGIWSDVYIRFLNYYELDMGFAVNPETTNIDRTRGGPLTKNKAGFEFFASAESDNRKDIVFEVDGFTYLSESGSKDYSAGLEIEWKPSDNVALSVYPNFSWDFPVAQWVPGANGDNEDITATETYGKRYIFAEMHRKTFSSSFRLNWTFSPELSLQVYVQPLISSGDYFNFKYLARSNSYDFNTFGSGNSTISYDGQTYTADVDGVGQAPSLSWDNPDFTFTSLRGNAVMRWEYQPGSTLFLAWTQNRSDFENNGRIRFSKPFPDRFLNREPDNIFLAKFTYWLGF